MKGGEERVVTGMGRGNCVEGGEGWLGEGKSVSDWKLFGNWKTIGALYNCPNLI